LAGSECGVLDGSEVVAKVAQAFAEEGEKVDPASKLKGEVSRCDVSDSSAGGCEGTVSVLGSRPSLGWLTSERRGSSPKLSGSNAGPVRKFATAADAAPYNHTVGKSPGPNTFCLASLSIGRLCGTGPDGSGTGSPTRALPLVMDRAVSRRLVYPPPPCCGGSISMSCILDRSMTTSPLIAQPPVPYPPALTDGESPCLLQRITALKTCQRG
jgi:hypothetical protein